MIRKANAVWRGTGKDGSGELSGPGGVLNNTPYSFKTRFEDAPGTNPGGADRRRPRGLLLHGAGLPAPGRGLRAPRAAHRGRRDAGEGRRRLPHQPLGADAPGRRPGLDPATFDKLAEAAEKGCPVSKVLNAEITLEKRLLQVS
jgi:osmotically inducible protein OsmC